MFVTHHQFTRITFLTRLFIKRKNMTSLLLGFFMYSFHLWAWEAKLMLKVWKTVMVIMFSPLIICEKDIMFGLKWKLFQAEVGCFSKIPHYLKYSLETVNTFCKHQYFKSLPRSQYIYDTLQTSVPAQRVNIMPKIELSKASLKVADTNIKQWLMKIPRTHFAYQHWLGVLIF